MKITVKAFGPETTKFLGRERIVEMNDNSNLDDLARKLEEEIKAQHNWTPTILSFSVLVNGRNVEANRDVRLRDGDTVIILAPIGGG